jgi:hypothetical protein
MAKTFSAIQTFSLTTTATSIVFTNIPQNFTDLKIEFSARSNNTGQAGDDIVLAFNGTTGVYSHKYLYGTGSAVNYSTGGYSPTYGFAGNSAGPNATANTFGNSEIYIPNYTGSQAKCWGAQSVGENNSASANQIMIAGLSTITAPITQITIQSGTGSTFFANSTFTLYGIGSGFKGTGGACYYSGGYAYHVFSASDAFVPSQGLTADILVVSGGGGGGGQNGAATQGGGGGAGGLSYFTSQNLTAGTSYTVTIGGGGAGGTAFNSPGAQGGSSQFGSLTAPTGGGYGAGTANGGNGGSGGGGGGDNSVYSGGTGTNGQGNNGSSGTGGVAANRGAGGGGGAGAAAGSASTATGAAGGAGLYYDAFGAATGTGQYVGGHYYYAGGGGGGGYVTNGLGGAGGGGTSGIIGGYNQPNILPYTSVILGAGLPNTGGGGSGCSYVSAGNANGYGGTGGSGIIMVRYPLTDSFTLS